jgi:hypothetical protein
MDINAEVLDVAKRAIDTLLANDMRSAFLDRAINVTLVADAIVKGSSAGRKEGWDVFHCSGMTEFNRKFMVQWDSDYEPPITQDEAVKLARAAGICIDDNGVLMGNDGTVIKL